jgi:hypothetical protein
MSTTWLLAAVMSTFRKKLFSLAARFRSITRGSITGAPPDATTMTAEVLL